MQKESKAPGEKKKSFKCDVCRGSDFSVNKNKKILECNVCGRIWKHGENIEADEQYAKLGGN